MVVYTSTLCTNNLYIICMAAIVTMEINNVTMATILEVWCVS